MKFRLGYLATILLTYIAGFQLIPEQLSTQTDWLIFSVFGLSYFLFIPVLYWFWVIRIGQQKKWKMIIPLSLGGLIARFSFPEEFVHYFEFIMWAKYPILAIVFALEIFVIVSVVKALWQARKLTGDPRVNLVSRFSNSDEDEKKLTIALMLAYEPSSWYYFIPRFSRHHPKALANLSLLSAKAWHIALVLSVLVLLTLVVYQLIVVYSEIAAILVSGFVFYGVIILSANYRLSRYYSIYLHDNKLIINNSMWGLMVVPLSSISAIEQGEWERSTQPEALMFGRGKQYNIKLAFSKPQYYYSNMGQAKENAEFVYLNINDSALLVSFIEQQKSSQNMPS
jgi:hypothetical protein